MQASIVIVSERHEYSVQEVAARRAQQRRVAEAGEAQRAPKRLYLYGFLTAALLAAVLAGAMLPVWRLLRRCRSALPSAAGRARHARPLRPADLFDLYN